MDDDERQGGPNVDFFGQISPPKQRLPNVAGARIPSPSNNRRRPPSRNRPQSAGSEQAGRGVGGARNAEGGRRAGDGSPSRPRALWEGEAYTLSEQVQEMLISVHSRLTGLEKGAQGEEKSVSELKEKLQLVEMDHAAMRAEQKSMATQERILQLERDVTQKIHR